MIEPAPLTPRGPRAPLSHQPAAGAGEAIVLPPADKFTSGGTASETLPRRPAFAPRISPESPLSQAVAPGPYSLPPGDAAARARWVAQTFQQANADVARANPAGLREKADKMSTSAFSYFRGAATACYLDMARNASPWPDEPRVRLLGDVHPENFGTYISAHGKLLYDLNDFDETADQGPFSWDVRRGATGWMLAAREAGHSPKNQEEVARAFVDAFTTQLRAFAEEGGEKAFRVDLDHSEGPVHRLLKKQSKAAPGDWVKKITEKAPDGQLRFVSSGELVRHPELVGKIADQLRPLGIEGVLDVAAKKDSGTASLGLTRYYALVDGHAGHRRDGHVLEVKQEVRSALEGVPFVEGAHAEDRGGEVAAASRSFAGDPYPDLGSFVIDPGAMEAIPPLDGHRASFLVRERPEVKAKVAETELGSDDMASVARTQGRLLAAAVARQGTGGEGTSAASSLSRFLDAHSDFASSIVLEAAASAERIAVDYESFKEAMGS